MNRKPGNIRNNYGLQLIRKRILPGWQLYVLLLPTLIYYGVFHYWPMYGVQLAFKEFIAAKGIMGSPWVGLINYKRFFSSYQVYELFRNTIVLSVTQLFLTFPIPIILAIMINMVASKHIKKFIQTVVFLPHFITVVVVVGILFVALSPVSGIVNMLIRNAGGTPIHFMGKAEWFRPLYIGTTVWQHSGWSCIIYLGALTTINPELYEAATVDGAGSLQRIIYIDIPSILPTATIMLILNAGTIMSIGFEKAFLMQTPLNIDTSEIISTYVYKMGLLNAQYCYSTAIGLLNNAINLALVLIVNQICRKLGETSVF